MKSRPERHIAWCNIRDKDRVIESLSILIPTYRNLVDLLPGFCIHKIMDYFDKNGYTFKTLDDLRLHDKKYKDFLEYIKE